MKNNPLIENNVCIILRSRSGAGKTTFAEWLKYMFYDAQEFEICCADDFHYDDKGNYDFKAENLSAAHGWCQNKAFQAMDDNVRVVVIANTNTKERDFAPYIMYGEKKGYKVVSLVIENRADTKNCHNVPDFVLDKQAESIKSSLKL
jgi:hypothetical protein